MNWNYHYFMREQFREGKISRDDMINYYVQLGYTLSNAKRLVAWQAYFDRQDQRKRKRRLGLIGGDAMNPYTGMPHGKFAVRVSMSLAIILMMVGLLFFAIGDTNSALASMWWIAIVLLWCAIVLQLSQL